MSPSGDGCKTGSILTVDLLAYRQICFDSQRVHESEELSRLANKESVGRESLKCSHCSTSGFGWANNRTRRKFLIKKHGGLGHDQVSLKIFSAQWRGIQVGERDRY